MQCFENFGGQMPQMSPNWLRDCLKGSFCGTISYMLRTKSALRLVCHPCMW